MIVHISLGDDDAAETICSLNFAKRVREEAEGERAGEAALVLGDAAVVSVVGLLFGAAEGPFLSHCRRGEEEDVAAVERVGRSLRLLRPVRLQGMERAAAAAAIVGVGGDDGSECCGWLQQRGSIASRVATEGEGSSCVAGEAATVVGEAECYNRERRGLKEENRGCDRMVIPWRAVEEPRSAVVRMEAVPRRWFCCSATRPRWTTARAVSEGADLRSRGTAPTLSPEKESTGISARSQQTQRRMADGALARVQRAEKQGVVMLRLTVMSEEERPQEGKGLQSLSRNDNLSYRERCSDTM
ncbi:hypothetical protein BHE74_00013959 [Ensete ventricosum]|nr:hypothetical protein BHE74_00013959 [Ensete ventricosum]